MRTRLALSLSLLWLGFAGAPVAAGEVHVRGYTRGDGTYVAPHVRSAPNNTRADNFGRASAYDRAYGVPASRRDSDNGGHSNRLDPDDDNDGVPDDDE